MKYVKGVTQILSEDDPSASKAANFTDRFLTYIRIETSKDDVRRLANENPNIKTMIDKFNLEISLE